MCIYVVCINIYIYSDWRVYTWLCTKIQVPAPCDHQEPKEAHDCIFPQPRQCEPLLRLERPMWAYLEAFLATKNELQRCSPKKHWCNHKTLQHQKKHAFASIGDLHLCIFASVCHPLLLWKCSSLIILPQLAPGCCKEENDLQPVSLFYHFGWLYLPCNTETSCLDTINRNFPRKKKYIYNYKYNYIYIYL